MQRQHLPAPPEERALAARLFELGAPPDPAVAPCTGPALTVSALSGALPAGRLPPGRSRTERNARLRPRLITALRCRRSAKRDHRSRRFRAGRGDPRGWFGQRIHKQEVRAHGGLPSGVGAGPASRRPPRGDRPRRDQCPGGPRDFPSVSGTDEDSSSVLSGRAEGQFAGPGCSCLCWECSSK
jgi:hypothetical protein